MRSAAVVVAGSRGLLLGGAEDPLWRLTSDGTARRLPAPVQDGMRLSPGIVVDGPARMLLATPYDPPAPGPPTLLVSYDEGESWLVEEVRD